MKHPLNDLTHVLHRPVELEQAGDDPGCVKTKREF
jgi:hypothetical protein